MRKREREKQELRDDAIKGLKRLGLKPGSKVYTSVTHVSSSGMTRHIRCYLVVPITTTESGRRRREHDIVDITGYVANALGLPRARGSKWDVVVSGAGMDMGFYVVYRLGRTLFPEGGPLDKSAPSRQVQEGREGRLKERDGGYLLRHAGL